MVGVSNPLFNLWGFIFTKINTLIMRLFLRNTIKSMDPIIHFIIDSKSLLSRFLVWVKPVFSIVIFVVPYLIFILSVFHFLSFTDKVNLSILTKKDYQQQYNSLFFEIKSLTETNPGITLPDFDFMELEGLINPSILYCSWAYFGVYVFAASSLFLAWVILGWIIPLFLRLSPVGLDYFFEKFSLVLLLFIPILYGNKFLIDQLIKQDALNMAEACLRLATLKNMLAEANATIATLGSSSTISGSNFFESARFGLLLFIMVNVGFMVLVRYLPHLLDTVGGGGSPEDDDIIPIEEEESSRKKKAEQPSDQKAAEPAESKGEEFLNSDQGMGTADVPPVGENRIPHDFHDPLSNPIPTEGTFYVFKDNLYTDGVFVSTSKYIITDAHRHPSTHGKLADTIGIPEPAVAYHIQDFNGTFEDADDLNWLCPMPDCSAMGWEGFSKTVTVNSLHKLICVRDIRKERMIDRGFTDAQFKESDTVAKSFNDYGQMVPKDPFVENYSVENGYDAEFLAELHDQMVAIGATLG